MPSAGHRKPSISSGPSRSLPSHRFDNTATRGAMRERGRPLIWEAEALLVLADELDVGGGL